MVGGPVPRQWGWWRRLPPSASAVGGVGLNSPHRSISSASEAAEVEASWLEPRKESEEHLTAGMSFTSAAGSKKKGFV